MFLLAASLLFFPHYEVTRAGESPVGFATDAKGYVYVVGSGADDAEYLSRFDPDGNLVYHVAPPPSNQFQTAFSAIAADNAGDVYAALSSQVVVRIDPAGNMVTYPEPGYPVVTAIAPGPDGSFYLTGSADPSALPTTPGASISSTQAAANGTGLLPFAMRIGPAGQLIYATFLDSYHALPNPSGVNINAAAIAVDAAGNAYIGGTNTDPDFPNSRRLPNAVLRAGQPDSFPGEAEPVRHGAGLLDVSARPIAQRSIGGWRWQRRSEHQRSHHKLRRASNLIHHHYCPVKRRGQPAFGNDQHAAAPRFWDLRVPRRAREPSDHGWAAAGFVHGFPGRLQQRRELCGDHSHS